MNWRVLSSPELPRLKIVGGSPSGLPPSDDDPAWEPRLDHAGRVCAYTRAVGAGGWLYLPGVAGYRLSAEDAYVEAFPEPGASADAITEGYYRVVLPMALHAGDHEVLHASAVCDAAGVHVFCGASRAGKSTIAAGLRQRGFEVWADDAVAFSARAGAITALPLPFALRLRSEVAHFLEEPLSFEQLPNGKLEALRYQAAAPRPIASVSLLERGSVAAISRLSASEALPAVLYHSFYFSLENESVRQRMANQFLDLIARVPVFRISLQRSLETLPRLLDDIEQHVLAAAQARSAA